MIGCHTTYTLRELLPMAHKFGSTGVVFWSTVAGMGIMALSLTLLGATGGM